MELRRRLAIPPERNAASTADGEAVPPVWSVLPLMETLAIVVTFGGALDLDKYFPHSSPHEPPPSLDKVSGIYGPGAVLGWVLAVNLMMYDAYRRKTNHPWYLNIARSVLVGAFVVYAIYDQLYLAWSGDFGASEAAARYVVDKAFESAALLYFLSAWRDLMDQSKAEHVLPTSNRPKARHSFKAWPALVLFLAWAIGRASEMGRNAYYPSRQPNGHPVWWRPKIPYELRPISLPCGLAIGILTARGPLKTKMLRGFGKGIWIAFAILHSGLFGTFGALRLTSKSIKDPQQWLPVIVSVLGGFGSYRAELKDLPHACMDRLFNAFCWTEEGTPPQESGTDEGPPLQELEGDRVIS